MSDKLVLEGVFSRGYGTIPKMVMKDDSLTIEAKGIYAYLCSYAGAGETAFPSVDLICADLGISDNRFYKHRKLLVENGYLRIERERLENGFSKNIYTICSVVHLQNEGIPNEPVYPQNVGIGNVDIRNVDIGNEGTNNNSLNNNSLNNNSINNNNNQDDEKSENSKSQKSKPEVQEIKKQEQNTKEVHRFYQTNFGIESQYIAQELEYLVEDLGIELVLEAMKRAIEYGKEFGYAKRIMKNWTNKGIDTMDKVQQADVAFENKTQNKFNNKPRNRKVESLPDWVQNTNSEQKNDSSADDAVTIESDPELFARLQQSRERLLNLSSEGDADASAN